MRKAFLLIAFVLLGAASLWAQSEAIILGHRGGRAEQDENTLSAFQNAWAAGIHSFETDIRMAKDGTLVVSHDASLKRRCGIDKKVEQMTKAELAAVKTVDGHPLLLLDDLLKFFGDKPGLYVEFEMKTSEKDLYPDSRIPEYCEKAYKALKKSMPKDADYSMSSFDYRSLRYLSVAHPDQVTMLIHGDPVNSKTIAVAMALGAKRMACGLNGTSKAAINEAHRNGLKVNLWPGAKVEDTLLALYLGADYLCTDIPIAMKAYIDGHPQARKARF